MLGTKKFGNVTKTRIREIIWIEGNAYVNIRDDRNVWQVFLDFVFLCQHPNQILIRQF